MPLFSNICLEFYNTETHGFIWFSEKILISFFNVQDMSGNTLSQDRKEVRLKIDQSGM